MEIIKILTVGTFDMFHPGHEYFLKTAKKYGTQLHTIVARDETVKKIKGFYPQESQDIRKNNIEKFDVVDFCYIGSPNDFLEIPLQIQPDILIQGYDQIIPLFLKEKLLQSLPYLTIIQIDSHHPQLYKSSLLRKNISSGNKLPNEL